MDSPIPIALIDDHGLMRSALADMIQSMGRYHVVVQAGNGVEYINAVQHGLPVAVAIVDLHMPQMNGFDTIRWIRAHQPHTRSVALSLDMAEETVARTLHLGACGFLPKTVEKDLFRDALDQVIREGHYINLDFLDTEDGPVLRSAHFHERQRAFALLTARETDFVRHVCDETEPTYDQIADRMTVSLSTVHGYRESIFRKLHVKSKAGLVIFAYKVGLVGREG